MDFKDLLFQHYCENSSDIPMVADVISNAAVEIAHALEPVQIAIRALSVVASAGLDPNLFHAVLPATPGAIMFFEGADEDWKYLIAAINGDGRSIGSAATYPYAPGKVYRLEDGIAIDLLRRKPGADHWSVYNDGVWSENGPAVEALEKIGRDL